MAASDQSNNRIVAHNHRPHTSNLNHRQKRQNNYRSQPSHQQSQSVQVSHQPQNYARNYSTNRQPLPAQADNNCENPLCFSYLIAILSSLLVVSGLYLSLTKLDLRFLYLSLAGLLSVFFSACLFCIGRLKTNQKSRRKPTSLPENFVLGHSRQQQQLQPTRPPPQPALLLTNTQLGLDENQPPRENNIANGELSVTIDANPSPQEQQTDSSHLSSDNGAAQNLINVDDEPQVAAEQEESEPEHSDEQASVRIAPSAPLPDSTADTVDSPQVSSRRTARPANMRRTLVMGLSGEQEIIEINEDDLDNMCVMPPSYESLEPNNKP